MLERRIIRRLLATAPLFALTACATTAGTATQAELAELKAQVRAMRESQARLEKRLERMELHESVSRARAASSSAPASQEPAPTPELAVVKLKPRKEAAPPLPTRVPIVEPSPEDMEMFISASDDGDSRADAGARAEREPTAQKEVVSVLEFEFEQAVAALRTGNVEGGVARLRRFAEDNPRHSLADNALYFSGLGQMGLNEHAAAARTFERLISSYPAGDAVLDGMLRLAECRLRLDKKDDARALYTRILTQFPGTAAATQAEQRLASLSH